MRVARTRSMCTEITCRRAVLAAIARREWLWRADQPVAFLFLFSRPRVVHRRVKGLSAPWRSDPLRFTENLWLENQP